MSLARWSIAVLGVVGDAVWVIFADSVSEAVFVAGSLLGSYAGMDHKVRLRFEGVDVDISA